MSFSIKENLTKFKGSINHDLRINHGFENDMRYSNYAKFNVKIQLLKFCKYDYDLFLVEKIKITLLLN